MFLQGTVTNGRSLVRFRTGAFFPGQPVQPLCVRRGWGAHAATRAVDTVTWSYVMDRALGSLALLTLAAPLTFLQLDYLPPVTPTQEDIADPRRFANRVQADL